MVLLECSDKVMASKRDSNSEEEKAFEPDVGAQQLSISSTDSKTELLRGNNKPEGRKKRSRPQESQSVVDEPRHLEEESRHAQVVHYHEDRDLEMGGGHSVGDTSSIDWHGYESTVGSEPEHMPALKPLPPFSCRSALYVSAVLAFAGLFAAYVGSGLVLLFHIADHLTACVRPFWMYTNYVLCAPLVLAILGLTNASPLRARALRVSVFTCVTSGRVSCKPQLPLADLRSRAFFHVGSIIITCIR